MNLGAGVPKDDIWVIGPLVGRLLVVSNATEWVLVQEGGRDTREPSHSKSYVPSARFANLGGGIREFRVGGFQRTVK